MDWISNSNKKLFGEENNEKPSEETQPQPQNGPALPLQEEIIKAEDPAPANVVITWNHCMMIY